MIKNLESHWGAELYFEGNRVTHSLGRNGYYLCKGVDFYKNSDGNIHITGITSKSSAASGRLVIPVQDIPEFIDILSKLYDNK